MATKYCIVCGNQFDSKRANHLYCNHNCEAKKWRITKGLNKLKDGRYCRQCGNHFYPSGRGGNNKQHCSIECSKKSARESRSKFWEKFGDKKKQKRNEYYERTKKKCGTDGNLKRFYSRFPDAPKECQSCGEIRVLDIAHKPEHRRNGSWRSVENSTPDKIWILCPTCHALLDRMHYLPSKLGLS